MNGLSRLDRLDEMFPELIRRFARLPVMGVETPGEIRIDVTENDKDYQVRAEIPGERREDINVAVDGNFVSISAEINKESETKKGSRLLMKETYVGKASRGFSLAHEIDEKHVIAKLEDGVLKLTLPKREGSRARHIAIE